MEPILTLKNVSKGYPGTPVLNDINLEVSEGEFIAILGFSGTGKSTLISLIAGLQEADSGEVAIRGKAVTGPGSETSLVFQSYSLFPWLTVEGNVALAVDAVHKDKSKAERAALVKEKVALVGLSHATDRKPSELSGGMRQRVAVARALAMTPEILLLDEPFGMLDSLTRWDLQDVLMEVWERTKVTAICVTHDVDEAILLADRVVMMTNGPNATIGKILEVDLPRPRDRKALLEHPKFYGYREEVLQFLADYEHGAHAEAA